MNINAISGLLLTLNNGDSMSLGNVLYPNTDSVAQENSLGSAYFGDYGCLTAIKPFLTPEAFMTDNFGELTSFVLYSIEDLSKVDVTVNIRCQLEKDVTCGKHVP
jgi:hypothetical protein